MSFVQCGVYHGRVLRDLVAVLDETRNEQVARISVTQNDAWPRRGRDEAAAFFGAPALPDLCAAQRLLIASIILLRPSGLKCLFFLLLWGILFPSALVAADPVTSRSADRARSMADRCFSS